MALGQKLRTYREERGWSQEKLARFLGDVTAATISNWERGENEPSLEKLILVADVLGVSIDELLGREVVPVGPKVDSRPGNRGSDGSPEVATDNESERGTAPHSRFCKPERRAA